MNAQPIIIENKRVVLCRRFASDMASNNKIPKHLPSSISQVKSLSLRGLRFS